MVPGHGAAAARGAGGGDGRPPTSTTQPHVPVGGRNRPPASRQLVRWRVRWLAVLCVCVWLWLCVAMVSCACACACACVSLCMCLAPMSTSIPAHLTLGAPFRLVRQSQGQRIAAARAADDSDQWSDESGLIRPGELVAGPGIHPGMRAGVGRVIVDDSGRILGPDGSALLAGGGAWPGVDQSTLLPSSSVSSGSSAGSSRPGHGGDDSRRGPADGVLDAASSSGSSVSSGRMPVEMVDVTSSDDSGLYDTFTGDGAGDGAVDAAPASHATPRRGNAPVMAVVSEPPTNQRVPATSQRPRNRGIVAGGGHRNMSRAVRPTS